MDKRIWQAAAHWLDHREDLDAKAEADFEAWLEADERHRRAFASLQNQYESRELDFCLRGYRRVESDATTDHIAQVERTPRLWTGLKKSVPAWLQKPMLAVAAAALVLAVVPLLRPAPDAPLNGDTASGYRVATGVAERKILTLEDGSTLHLNASTRLHIAHTAEARTAVLETGEAFFDVAHDRQRPFFVDTGSAQIRVVGTSFNVDRRPHQLQVTVHEGRVDIEADRAVSLGAGQHIVIENALMGQVKEVGSPTLASDWRDGWIEVQSQPLTGVLDQLQRYLAQEIIVDPDLATQQRISGRFHLDQPADTLALIAALYNLELLVGESQITLSAP